MKKQKKVLGYHFFSFVLKWEIKQFLVSGEKNSLFVSLQPQMSKE